jgi:hypothetical protein
MKHLLRGVLAAVAVTSALCAPVSAATVTVRVEGDTTTLVPLTSVTTQPGQIVKDGNQAHSCDAEHAIGALELATGGDWNGTWFNGLGYSVDTVKGETHNGANNDFFSFWIDGKSASQGVCDQTLADGDQLLFYPDCFGAGCQSPSPLDLTVPATAQKGAPFNVHAVTLDGSGGSSPAAGVTVTAGGASATTDSAGDAALTVATTGSLEVRATKPGTVRSTGDRVCVHDGNDGTCGTTSPSGSTSSSSPAQTQTANTTLRDTTAPHASITTISEGHVFAHGRGPRTLHGTVAGEPAGLHIVKLRLTRNDGGRCSYFSGRFERFRPARCGASNGKWFGIGTAADWSYLLPSALPRGRYVLDVNAVDKAFNRDDARRRGGNRIVFVVR